MGRALLALLLVAAAVPGAQARDALQSIDDCVARLDERLDVGYARIAERCPELASALSESPWARWLPADWTRPHNQLSSSGLSELRTLLARADGPEVRRRAPPRTERVAAVLSVLTAADQERTSWWLRLKDWLRRMLTPRAMPDEGWLQRWLAEMNISNHAIELIAWGAFALVVLIAGGIVVIELRVAGLLGGRHSRSRVRQPQRTRAGPTLAELERAVPARQPGLLLELITLRLAEQDRLPPARALTVRELRQRARLDDESSRSRLTELVTVCERVRYSGQDVGAASLAAALHGGRQLLATLDALPALPRAQPQ